MRPAEAARPRFFPLRELLLGCILTNIVLALIFTPMSVTTLWQNLVYNHTISGSILLLEELVRRRFWGQSWPPRHWMALLMLVAVPLGGAIGLALGSWLTDTSPMDGPLPLSAAANLWIVLTITLAASGVLLGGLWQRSRLLEARASAQAAQRGQTLAELHALQAQVEPHFLFNTLAHLDALISQPTRHEARALLSHLTDYLHRTQPTARPAASQLSDELARIEPWLHILAIRFGARLRWRIHASPQAASCQLPPMLLQPLVENAIRHGIEPAVQGGELSIHAELCDGMLHIRVCDNGVGLNAPNARPGAGSGLANIRARLAALYGQTASLTLTPLAPHGVEARLILPAHYADHTPLSDR